MCSAAAVSLLVGNPHLGSLQITSEHRRRDLLGDVRRQVDGQRRRQDPLGCIRAVLPGHVGDAISSDETGHAWANLLNYTGGLDARMPGKGRVLYRPDRT